jgi:hypothetical protein
MQQKFVDIVTWVATHIYETWHSFWLVCQQKMCTTQQADRPQGEMVADLDFFIRNSLTLLLECILEK